MNWGKGYVETQASQAEDKSNVDITCQMDIGLGVLEIGGEKKICYNSGTTTSISFILENTGRANIEGFRMLIIGEGDNINVTELNMSIDAGSVAKGNVTLTSDFGDLEQIQFTPKIDVEGHQQPVMCTKNSLVIDSNLLFECE